MMTLDQTPPPALTWTHLFPAAASYACVGGPHWFRERLAALQSRGTSPVRVVWNSADGATKNLQELAGFAAINCRAYDAELQSAGFTYIRRFAALPSLKKLRWLVPLDGPRVSSQALSLYTPTRWSAKALRATIRLAMQTRAPLWYRDHVCIAQRELPPLEMAINPLFGDQPVRWALSSGAPEGARNRKASALVIGQDASQLAFVKLARSEITRRLIVQEGAVLEHLSRLPTLAGATPSVLFTGDIDGTRVLAQRPLAGRPAPVGITAAHRAFLRSLQTPVTVNAAAVPMAAALPARLRALPDVDAHLLEASTRVLQELAKFSVPLTMIHGDFAPWNLRLHERKLLAFDWEYGELHGLPLMDEIHYRLQCGWLLEEWSTPEALADLDAFAASRPLGLDPAQVETLASAYLLDALARLLGEGYADQEEVIAWHRRLLDRLSFRAGHSHMGERAA